MMIDFHSALNMLNDTDTKEHLRRLQPYWSSIIIDPNGAIVDILKHKERPTAALQKEHLRKFPQFFQITAWRGRFGSEDELRKAAEEAAELGQAY